MPFVPFVWLGMVSLVSPLCIPLMVSIPKNYGDKSEGFYRRLIIVRFNHSVPEDKRDPELLEKFRCEADGIFQFALEGLRRLMQNHFHFSETKANAQELQKYREDSNSVLAFVRDCCTLQMENMPLNVLTTYASIRNHPH